MGDMILPEHWEEPLRAELSQPYIAELVSFLRSKSDAGHSIFPAEQNWFRALELTPLDQVRAVILGQDPYHGPGQAHGLSFSVAPGVKAPPSLKNIFKELQRDIGIPPPAHGFLEHWARQGVLLLNTVLTVEMGRPGSHQKRGWERFTDAIIRAVSAKRDPVVFFLWGGPAQEKGRLVDTSRHLLLAAPHPSPLSAYRGFFGCKHFSRANAFLQSRGRGTIDWALPECGTSA